MDFEEWECRDLVALERGVDPLGRPGTNVYGQGVVNFGWQFDRGAE